MPPMILQAPDWDSLLKELVGLILVILFCLGYRNWNKRWPWEVFLENIGDRKPGEREEWEEKLDDLFGITRPPGPGAK